MYVQMINYEQKQRKFDGCIQPIKFIVFETFLSSMSTYLGVVSSRFSDELWNPFSKRETRTQQIFPAPQLRFVRTQ